MQTNLVLVMCLLSAALILAEHYFPWKKLIGRDLPRPVAYILGVLTILLPVCYLYVMLPWLYGWQAVAVMWYVTISAGFATVLTYLVDAWLDDRQRAKIAEREGLILREVMDGKTESR